MHRPRSLASSTAAFLLLIALGGCSSARDGYPSLASRPIEKTLDDAPAEAPAPTLATDAELERKVAEQKAAVDAAAGSFERAATETRAAIGRASGQAAGGEAWIAAQQALSSLDAARAPIATAIVSLDELRLDAAQRATAVDTTSLDSLYARVEAIDSAQRAALAELTAILPLP